MRLWHNEKYLCGGISQADWDRIDQNGKSPIIYKTSTTNLNICYNNLTNK